MKRKCGLIIALSSFGAAFLGLGIVLGIQGNSMLALQAGEGASSETSDPHALSISKPVYTDNAKYKVSVNIPLEDNGTPYPVYSVNLAFGTFTLPTASSGKFLNAVNGSTYYSSITAGTTALTGVEYLANESATAEGIATDLGGIVYSAKSDITIYASKIRPNGNDAYFQGHYYKVSSSTATWVNAMNKMLEGDSGTYSGYKGHPVTITSIEENRVLSAIRANDSNKKIWLGAVTQNYAKTDDGKVSESMPVATGYSKGSGAAWKWVWNTPEGDKTTDGYVNQLPSNANGATYWDSSEPSSGYCVYFGYGTNGSGVLWDDLDATNAWTGGNQKSYYYVTEYSPISSSGSWIYDLDSDSNTQCASFNVTSEGQHFYVSTQNELNYALSNVTDNSVIELTADINLTAAQTLSTAKTYTLTGGSAKHTLSRTSSTSNNNILDITNGNVTLKDIVIDGSKTSSTSAGQFLVKVGSGTNTPSLTLEEGTTIENGAAGGVLLGVSSNITSKGSLTIKDGAAIKSNGKGTFYSQNGSSSNTGGVGIIGNTTFLMEGGEISGNTGAYTGGICCYYNNGGSATILGGTISGNTANGNTGAGGIYIESNGKLTLNGGTIKNNSYVGNGGNTQTTGSSSGGVAYWNNTTSLSIGGGTNPLVIDDNYALGIEENIKINDSVPLTRATESVTDATTEEAKDVTTPLKEGSSIGVSLVTALSKSGNKTTVMSNAIESDASYFFSDKPTEAGILYDSDTLYLSYDKRTTDVAIIDIALPSSLKLAEGSGSLKQTIALTGEGAESASFKDIVIEPADTKTTFLSDTVSTLNNVLSSKNLIATLSYGQITISQKNKTSKVQSVTVNSSYFKTQTGYNVYGGDSMVGKVGKENMMNAAFNSGTGYLTWDCDTTGNFAFYNSDGSFNTASSGFTRFYCEVSSSSSDSVHGSSWSSMTDNGYINVGGNNVLTYKTYTINRTVQPTIKLRDYLNTMSFEESKADQTIWVKVNLCNDSGQIKDDTYTFWINAGKIKDLTSKTSVTGSSLPEGVKLTSAIGSLSQAKYGKTSAITTIVLQADDDYADLNSDQATALKNALADTGLTAAFDSSDKTIKITGTPKKGTSTDLSSIISTAIGNLKKAQAKIGTAKYKSVTAALSATGSNQTVTTTNAVTSFDEVSGATLKSGWTLITPKGSVKASAASTIDMDSDGLVTLTSGKAVVNASSIAGADTAGNVKVSTSGGDYALSGDVYTVDTTSTSGALTLTVASGKTATVDGTATYTNGTFTITKDSENKATIVEQSSSISNPSTWTVTGKDGDSITAVKNSSKKIDTKVSVSEDGSLTLTGGIGSSEGSMNAAFEGKTHHFESIDNTQYQVEIGSDSLDLTIKGTGSVKMDDKVILSATGTSDSLFSITSDENGYDNVALMSGSSISMGESTISPKMFDAKIKIDTSSEIMTIVEGSGNVSGGSSIKVATGTGEQAITNNGSNDIAVSAYSTDTTGTSSASVTITKDGSFSIGGKTYSTSVESGASFTLDDNGALTLTSGSATTSGSVDVSLKNTTVSVSSGDEKTVTINKDETSGTATIEVAADGSIVIGEKTYKASPDNDAILTVDENGNIILSKGALILTNGESVDVSTGSGKTSKVENSNTGEDETTVTVTASETKEDGTTKEATVSVEKGESVKIGDESYLASSDQGANFSISSDNSVTLTNGGAVLKTSESVNVSVGSKTSTIKNEGESGEMTVYAGEGESNGSIKAEEGSIFSSSANEGTAYSSVVASSYDIDKDGNIILTDGKVSLDKGESVSVSVGNSSSSIKNNGSDEASKVEVEVTDDTSSEDNEKATITVSEKGSVSINDKEFANQSADEDATLSVDSAKNVTLVSGKVSIPADVSVSVSSKGGNVEITNSSVSSDSNITVKAGDNDNEATVSLDKNDSFSVNDKAYEAVSDTGASFSVDKDGNVTLLDGSVSIGTGTSVNVSVGGHTSSVSNESGEGSESKVIVNKDADDDSKASVTVDENGKVKINDEVYTNASSTEDASFFLDETGKATLTSGSISLDNGSSVTTSSGKSVKNESGEDSSSKITVTVTEDNKDEISIGKDGKATIDGKEITTISDAKIDVDEEGKLTLKEGSISINGEISVDVVTDSKSVSVSVPEGKTYTIDTAEGIVSGLGKGDTVTIDGYRFTSGSEEGSFSLDTSSVINLKTGDSVVVSSGKATSVSTTSDETSSAIALDGKNKGDTTITALEGGSLDITLSKGDHFNNNGSDYSASSEEGASFNVKVSTVTLTGGKADLAAGKSVNVSSKGEEVVVSNDSDSSSDNSIIVEVGDDSSEAKVTLDKGEKFHVGSGYGYEATSSEGASFSIDEKGNVTLLSGETSLGAGHSVNVSVGGNASSVSNESDEGSGSKVIVSKDADDDSKASVTVDESGKVKIGENTYVNTSETEDASFSIDEKGNVILEKGSISFDKGSSVSVSSKSIENTGDKSVKIEKGDEGATISIEKDSSVKIKGDEDTSEVDSSYTYTSKSEKADLSIDNDGNLSLKDGSLTLGSLSSVSVSVGDKSVSIKNADIDGSSPIDVVKNDDGTYTLETANNRGSSFEIDGSKYTSKGQSSYLIDENGHLSLSDGSVSIGKGGSVDVSIGGKVVTYENTSESTYEKIDIVVDKDKATAKVTVYNTDIQSIKIGDNSYTGKGFVLSVDKDGKATLAEGNLSLGKGASVNVSAGNKEMSFTNGSESGASIKIDPNSDKITFTVEKGGSVTLGEDTYVASSSEKATFSIDAKTGAVSLISGKASLGKGESVSVSSSGKSISVSNDGEGAIEVEAGSADSEAKVILDNGESFSFEDNTYSASSLEGDTGASFSVSEGKVTLISGKAEVSSGKSVSVSSKGGEVTIKNESASTETDDKTIIVEAGDKDSEAKVTLDEGESFSVDEKTYAASSEEASFSVDEDKKVTLISGKASIDKGVSVTVSSGKAVSNDGESAITVEAGEGNDTVAIGKGGKVSIGDDSYANASSEKDASISIDENGNVSLVDGSLSLDEGSSVNVSVGGNASSVSNESDEGSGSKVIVSKDADDDSKASVTVDENGKVKINDEVYINASSTEDASFSIDENGKATLTGGSISLGKDVSVDVSSSSVKNTGEEEVTVTSTEGRTSVTIEKGGSASIGEDAYNASSSEDATFSIDETGKATLIDGKVEVSTGYSVNVSSKGDEVTIKNGSASAEGEDKTIIVEAGDASNEAKVTLDEGESFSIGDETYTSASEETSYSVSLDENKEVKVTLLKGESSLSTGSSINVSVGEKSISIENKEGNGITVSKDSDGSTLTIGTNGKVSIDGKEYMNASTDENLTLTVDTDGKVHLKDGSLALIEGSSVSTSSGKEVTNKSAKDVTIVSNEKGESITIDEEGSISIDNKEYANASSEKDASISVDKDGKVTLVDGSISISTGASVDVSIGGSLSSITNESGEGAEGEIIISKDADDSSKANVKIGKDGKISVSDGNSVYTYESASDDLTGKEGASISIEEDGKLTLIDGAISISGGASVSVSGKSIKNEGDVALTVVTGETADVITIEEGGSASIDGHSYEASKDGGSISYSVDKATGEVTLISGKVTLKGGESVNVSVGKGSCTVSNDNKDGESSVSVEADKDTGEINIDFDKSVSISSGEDSSSYTNASSEEDASIKIDGEGNAVLVDGSVSISKGSSIVTSNGVSVSNGGDKDVEVTKDGSKDIVTIEGEGKALIGDKEYVNASSEDDATISLDEEGKVELVDGSLSISKGGSVDVSIGEKEIKIKNESDEDSASNIIVSKDDEGGKAEVRIEKGGKASIDGKEYINASSSEDASFSVDEKGSVTLISGSVALDKDAFVDVSVGGKKYTITSGGESGTKVDIDEEKDALIVSIEKGESVKIGEATITSSSDEGAIINVGKDGKITLISGKASLSKDESIYAEIGEGKSVEVTNKSENEAKVEVEAGSSSEETSISIGEGGKADIGENRYEASIDAEASLSIDEEGNVSLTGGSLTLSKDESISVALGEKEVSITNEGEGEISVSNNGDGSSSIASGEGSSFKVNDDSYISNEKSSSYVDEDGNLTLIDGSLSIDKGTSVSIGSGEKKIEVDNDGDTSIAVSASADDPNASVSGKKGGHFHIGGKSFAFSSEGDNEVSVTPDGYVKLISGSVSIGKDASVDVSIGEKEVSISSSSEEGATVSKDGDKASISMDEGGSIAIDGKSYSSNEDGTSLSVDEEGKVTLEDGSTTLGKDASIMVESEEGSSSITNNGEEGVSIKKSEDGSTSIELDEGASVSIDGVEYQATGEGAAKLVINKDGTVAITEGEINNKGLEGGLEAWQIVLFSLLGVLTAGVAAFLIVFFLKRKKGKGENEPMPEEETRKEEESGQENLLYDDVKEEKKDE